jgi:hypothetical protein
MEAHTHFFDRLRERVPHLDVDRRAVSGRLSAIGITAGIGGLLVLAAPLVIYDWAKAGHSALELPMAVSGWLFGLNHFAQNGYHWWPIVIGTAFLLAYWGALGVAFAALEDRVYRVRTLAGSLLLGGVWSFVSFMFFWYMLLPIARDGAPFRQTAAATAFVAPNWVWILGFALSGLATAACYRALASFPEAEATATTLPTSRQAA